MEHAQFSAAEKQVRKVPMFFGLCVATAIAFAGTASRAFGQDRPIESPAQDICTQPDFQAKLIAKFNSASQLTDQHGKLVKVEGLRNELSKSIQCKGKYFFADGSVKEMGFGYIPNGSIPSIAGGIPNKCKTDDTGEHIAREVPRILDLRPDAAGIAKVQFLADVPRTIYYPAVGSADALHMLQCPVTITWTNGHQDSGYYMEWEDHHQQVRASFTPKPIQPPSRDY